MCGWCWLPQIFLLPLFDDDDVCCQQLDGGFSVVVSIMVVFVVGEVSIVVSFVVVVVGKCGEVTGGTRR